MKALARKRRRLRVVKFDQPRESNGLRIINMLADKEARERADFEETRLRRIKQFNLQSDPDFAAKQECGHPVGRLARQLQWSDETATRRIAAGFRFADVVTAYNKDVLGAPNGNPQAMDMTKVGGLSTREITQERIQSLKAAHTAIMDALATTGRKWELLRVLTLACVEDCPTENWNSKQVYDLVKALDTIASA